MHILILRMPWLDVPCFYTFTPSPETCQANGLMTLFGNWVITIGASIYIQDLDLDTYLMFAHCICFMHEDEDRRQFWQPPRSLVLKIHNRALCQMPKSTLTQLSLRLGFFYRYDQRCVYCAGLKVVLNRNSRQICRVCLRTIVIYCWVPSQLS